jgi:glycosyltransferase involved in cell wall biosynthesis
MRILLIAPPHVRVAPDAPGPAGQVALLAEGLAARGHDVTVCAAAPCEVRVPAHRIPLPAPETAGEDRRIARLYALRAVTAASAYDVAHSFAGAEVAACAVSTAAPLLVTLGTTPAGDDRGIWGRYSGAYTTVSWAHAARARTWLPRATLAGAVYPAVDVDTLPYEPDKEPYLVALGPIGPDAGTDIALAAARKAELPLVITGPVAPDAAVYFEQAIIPRLDGVLVRYLPAVGPEERRALLARARGLLLTPRAARPWYPAGAEALAMGTPVVALDRGPMRELVVHAETGFVADDLAGLVSGIDRLDAIDPRSCRRRAERCWDVAQVAAAYEAIYAALPAGAAAVHPELEALDPRRPVAA